MEPPKPQSMRVLIRPPLPPSHPHPTPTPPPPPPLTPSSHPPPPQNGVVVIGFIGRHYEDVSSLINRILDSNIFGSGNSDKPFTLEKLQVNDNLNNWLVTQNITFYHDEENAVLYLQFFSTKQVTEFELISEDHELSDLQAMLFIFSVCHLVVFIQEGSRFDTQILKKFRILQAAKNSMAPFIKSQTNTPSVSGRLPNNSSPGRNRGMFSLTGSASLLPGQCSPVILFVYLDDYSDSTPTPSTVDQNSSSNFRKKLESSLEAQIRFSIKKCRTLSGSESGTKNGVNSSLFSLDSSKAVALIDSSSNQKGESLEFAITLIEDLLNGKSTSDSFLLESLDLNTSKEDILSFKDFIHKQSNILHGKSTTTTTSTTTSGGAAPSPLPNFAIWFSNTQIILNTILTNPETVTCLDNSTNINTKFSTQWCKKALPLAKKSYLKDLPKYYSTSQHETQLNKALHVFNSMVKGSSIHYYTQILKSECTSIWSTNRQLCDSVSLTGKPCKHPRHVGPGPHCSGYVFLHACACGRTRKLRPDPFDFETASNYFIECDKHLSRVSFSENNVKEMINSWSLIRVGSSKYYEHLKGLVQNGFYGNERFLMKWNILLNESILTESVKKRGLLENLKPEDKNVISYTMRIRKPFSEVVAGPGSKSRKQPLTNQSDEKVVENQECLVNNTIKEISCEVFIGFEHECPQGHRFILTLNHLRELVGPDESIVANLENSKSGKNGKAYKKSSDKLKDNGILSSENFKTSKNESVLALLNRDLPIYMNCPHCKDSKNSKNSKSKKNTVNEIFAGSISQLQRIFLVTPSFPVILATCPIVQFDGLCVTEYKKKVEFSVGKEVILPPDSFISLRLPFIYGVKLEDGNIHSLKPFENYPERTAWIVKGTALKVLSRG